jgi:hypothetical protein
MNAHPTRFRRPSRYSCTVVVAYPSRFANPLADNSARRRAHSKSSVASSTPSANTSRLSVTTDWPSRQLNTHSPINFVREE